MSYIVVFFVILAIIITIIIVSVAYSVSAAYQQTITLKIPFEKTYRFLPFLNDKIKYKLDSINITVTGSIKKEQSSTIVPGIKIKELVKENIITPYKGCLIMREADTFTINENILKRCPIVKDPTLENLSIIFFNKLAPMMPYIGCQLVSIELESEGLTVTHSRYKISNYKV